MRSNCPSATTCAVHLWCAGLRAAGIELAGGEPSTRTRSRSRPAASSRGPRSRHAPAAKRAGVTTVWRSPDRGPDISVRPPEVSSRRSPSSPAETSSRSAARAVDGGEPDGDLRPGPRVRRAGDADRQPRDAPPVGGHPSAVQLLDHLYDGSEAGPGPDWDVGHFSCIVAGRNGPRGALYTLADTYPALGNNGVHLQPTGRLPRRSTGPTNRPRDHRGRCR